MKIDLSDKIMLAFIVLCWGGAAIFSSGHYSITGKLYVNNSLMLILLLPLVLIFGFGICKGMELIEKRCYE